MELNDYKDFEIQCFLCKPESKLSINFKTKNEDIIQNLVSQKYLQVVEDTLKMFNFGPSPEKCYINLTEMDKSNDLLLYCCGVSCLQIFVQNNWTGPRLRNVPRVWDLDDEAMKKFLVNTDTESTFIVTNLAKNTQYLVLAMLIFENLIEKNSDFKSSSWWFFRCLNLNSQVLNEKSESIYSSMKEVIDKTHGFLKEVSLDSGKNCLKSLEVQFYLECGHCLLHHYDYKLSEDYFNKAKETVDIDFKFTGAYGVRTKFQQKALPQLIMNVERNADYKFHSTVTKEYYSHIPKNIELDDDTLLDKVKLSEEKETTDLCSEEACVILAACTSMQKTSPKHKLRDEEVRAMLELLTSCTRSGWCVYTEALRMRCTNEKSKSRKVERGMAQMEELVKFVVPDENQKAWFEKQDTPVESTAHLRQSLFFACKTAPVWQLESEFADFLVSLGLTSTALEMYKRLENWEEVVKCLIRSDRKDEGMKLCEKMIEENPTPNILCFYGDLTRNGDCYNQAWELSGEKCSRAMNSLAVLYYTQNDVEEAVKCFEKSLAVLTMQKGTWFTLGCCLMAIQNFEKAANAFRRCLQLDWDNYQAWTNLSTAYVKSKKNKEAFLSLTEGLKYNHDQHEMWDNYLAISADIGKFDEVVTSYNKLLDLKKKHEDYDVLTVVTKACVENIPDADGRPGGWIKPRLLKLLGRITSMQKGSSKLWKCYSMLYSCEDSEYLKVLNERRGIKTVGNGQDMSKALDYMHKSVRLSMNNKDDVMKNEKDLELLIEDVQKLVELCEGQSKAMVTTVKFSLNNLVSKLKSRESELLDDEMVSRFQEYQKKVEECKSKVEDIMKKL